MKTKWAMLRLDKATHARLVAFLKGWKTWKKRLVNGRRFKLWQQPSLSDAVAELLDRVDGHKARSKRSGGKQKANGRPSDTAPPATSPSSAEPNGHDRVMAMIAAGLADEDVLDLE